jgi:hypothetical protein
MDPFNQTIMEPHKGQPIVILNMSLMSFIIISMLNGMKGLIRRNSIRYRYICLLTRSRITDSFGVYVTGIYRINESVYANS